MRKGLVIVTGWVGAVAAAGLFGVAAIGALGPDADTGGPLSQRDVTDRLAQTTPVPATSGEPRPTPTATRPAGATAVRQYFTTTGGGLWASCAGGLASVDTMTPRQGYRLDGSDRGPAPTAWVRFKQDVQHGHGDEYTVTVTCPGGVPRADEAADR